MTAYDTLDKALARYRLTALATIFSFIAFVILLIMGIQGEKTDPFTLFTILLSGMLWIGTTALSRHAYVILKTALRKRIGTLEFLSTNLVVVLFPVAYRQLKKEVESFKINNTQP